MINKYIKYLKDNPNNYWFKRKLYGWGWVPVKWQGWVVLLISITIGIVGIHIGEVDDSPGVMLLGILLMIGIIFTFGFWKGEKPKWQWGFPKEE